MNEETRRKLEMGKRALEFCRAHPDSSPEYNAAVARLEALLARAKELEMLEKEQERLARKSGLPGTEARVIPLKKSLQREPPDPAA